MLAENGRLAAVRQAIVNPSDEALWNLLSSCSNTGAGPPISHSLLSVDRSSVSFAPHRQSCSASR